MGNRSGNLKKHHTACFRCTHNTHWNKSADFSQIWKFVNSYLCEDVAKRSGFLYKIPANYLWKNSHNSCLVIVILFSLQHLMLLVVVINLWQAILLQRIMRWCLKSGKNHIYCYFFWKKSSFIFQLFCIKLRTINQLIEPVIKICIDFGLTFTGESLKIFRCNLDFKRYNSSIIQHSILKLFLQTEIFNHFPIQLRFCLMRNKMFSI